ncbi:hypothetical protein I6M49_22030 [Shewanella algae]|uniref:hypothetical protein n=1 Tax=Shewanella algae TaxID=38313 RepID=UPI001AAD2D0C|nr:hypothetical protein [Shewanella algae]MBO2656124.1 hypothetical protein [Shewanella algae]
MKAAVTQTVPKKSDGETGFAEQSRLAIKAAMEEMGLQVGGLFVLLYERDPVGTEVQTLRNRLNRGNPGADFLGLCVAKMSPLQARTMKDFFKVTVQQPK